MIESREGIQQGDPLGPALQGNEFNQGSLGSSIVLPHYSPDSKGPTVRTLHLLPGQYHNWWLLGGHSA